MPLNCYGDFASAYVAWKALGDTAIYVPVTHGNPLPEFPDGSEVYVQDIKLDVGFEEVLVP